jgi:hypothetical protein
MITVNIFILRGLRMRRNPDDDSDLFFWVKNGNQRIKQNRDSVQGIQQEAPSKKIPPKKRKGTFSSARAGMKEGWIRATLIVREENLNKLKALAYWDRRDLKEITDDALSTYFKNKKIKPVPPKK